MLNPFFGMAGRDISVLYRIYGFASSYGNAGLGHGWMAKLIPVPGVGVEREV